MSPLDFSFVVRRFIDRIKPRLVIFNELEVWPNWISLLHRRSVPMLLINGRISETAFRPLPRFSASSCGRFFRRIDCFLVQNEIYRQRFLRLHIPAEKITVCGNIKADEADNSLQGLPARQEVRAHLRLAAPAKKIVVLASSHEQRRKYLHPGHRRPGRRPFFSSSFPAMSSAPRPSPPNCSASGVAPRALQPAAGRRTPDTQALIYDRMGYLFPIMSIADIVFMGGTFDAANRRP